MTNGQRTPATDAAAPPVAPQRMPVARFILVRLPYLICGVLLLAAVVINFTNVVGRYVFSAPVPWAEEVLIYMIVWGVFISVGSITYQGLHLRMDLLVMSVRGQLKTFLGGLTAVLIVVCSAFMIVQSTRILQLYFGSGETSMGAKVPLIYPHAALFAGFVLAAAAAIIRLRAYLTDRFD